MNESLTAASVAEAAASTSMQVDQPTLYDRTSVVLKPTDEQIKFAREFGEKRTRAHEGRRKLSEDLGSWPLNLRGDYFGILGERLAFDWLKAEGYSVTGWIPFSKTAPPGVDFTCDSVRVDVKTTLPSKEWVNINCKAHSSRCPDVYGIVWFHTPETARLLFVEGKEVDNWPVQTVHSPFHTKPVADLLRPVEAQRRITR